MNARPDRPDGAHHPVEQKRRARQVSRILEQQDEKEQDDDLRQKHQHAADPRQHAVDEQILQQAGRHRRRQPIAERGNAEFDLIHRQLCPGKHGLKYQKQNDRQDHGTEHRVQHDGIDAVAQGHAVEAISAHQSQDSAHLGLVVFDVRGAQRQPNRGRPGAHRDRGPIEHCNQGLHAGRFHPDGLDHGHTQFVGEPVRIDHDALAPRDVAHVERHHHGQSQPLQAQCQSKVLAQIGGVGDADHEIRLALSGAAAEQHVGGDLFVRRQWIEAVGARQIQDSDAPSRGREQRALFALDGDSGVVGNLLTAAGENVE